MNLHDYIIGWWQKVEIEHRKDYSDWKALIALFLKIIYHVLPVPAILERPLSGIWQSHITLE
jgi:hypothetical protein